MWTNSSAAPAARSTPRCVTGLGHQFGFDFSAVRVHTDAEAAASAGRLCADAYTVGSNIVFALGRFSPYTTAGRRLLRPRVGPRRPTGQWPGPA